MGASTDAAAPPRWGFLLSSCLGEVVGSGSAVSQRAICWTRYGSGDIALRRSGRPGGLVLTLRLPFVHVLQHLLLHLGRCRVSDVRGHVPRVTFGINEPSATVTPEHIRYWPLWLRAGLDSLGHGLVNVLDEQVERGRRSADALGTSSPHRGHFRPEHQRS